MPPPGTLRARCASVLENLVVGTVLIGVFASALVSGVVLHMNLPLSRRLFARSIEQVLDQTLQGRFLVGELEAVGLRGIRARDLRVIDGSGREVLRISTLRARANLIQIVRALASAGPGRELRVFHVRADGIECRLHSVGSTAIPTLVQAFSLRTRTTPTRSATQYPLLIAIPDIEVGRAWCRSNLEGIPPFEAQLQRVHAALRITENQPELDVDRFGAELRGFGATSSQVTGEFHMRGLSSAWTTLDGFAGELPIAAVGAVREGQLQLRLDLPRATFDPMRALWPKWPLRAEAQIHLEASGEWPVLATQLTATIGRSQIDARGTVAMAKELAVDTNVQATHLNLQDWITGSPITDLGGRAHLIVHSTASGANLVANGSLEATNVRGIGLPGLDFEARFEENHLKAKGTLHEVGSPVQFSVDLDPDGALSLDARAPGFMLQKSPRIADLARLQGYVDLQARGQLTGNDTNLHLEARARGFSVAGLALASGQLSGTLSGNISRPESWTIQAVASGTGLALASIAFDKAGLTIRGPLREPSVALQLAQTGGTRLRIAGRIAPWLSRATGVEITALRGETRLLGQVQRLEQQGGVLTVQGLSLGGSHGSLEGDLSYGHQVLELAIQGDHLDVGAWAEFFGSSRGTFAGTLQLQANAQIHPDYAAGNIHMEIASGVLLEGLPPITAQLTSQLEGNRVSADISALLPGVAAIRSQGTAVLAGSALQPSAWTGATGQGEIQLGEFQLSQLVNFAPSDLSIQRIGGVAELRARVSRQRPSGWPSITATLETRGLEIDRLILPESPEESLRSQTLRGIEMVQGISLSGETGYALGSVQVGDSEGTLANVTAQAQFDWGLLFQPTEALVSHLTLTPFEVVATFPERELAQLPELIRSDGLSGQLSGRMSLKGTLADPIWQLEARASHLAAQGMPVPLDAIGSVQYQSQTGQLSATGEIALVSRPNLPVALLNARGSIDARSLLALSTLTAPRWQGEAVLSLYQMPISALPPLVGGELQGVIESGRISLYGTGTTKDAGSVNTLGASIAIRGFRMGPTALGDGELSVALDRGSGHATLKLTGPQNWLRAEAQTGLSWTERIDLPSLSQQASLRVDTHGFNAGALAPFSQGILDDLDGLIDASLALDTIPSEAPKVSVAPTVKDSDATNPDASPSTAKPPWRTSVAGSLLLREGTLKISGLGLELTDAQGLLVAKNVGRLTQLHLQGFQAKAQSNQINLRANADFYLNGLELLHGNASLSARDLPIPVQGVTLATGTGSALVAISQDPARTRVNITVPEFVAELPRSASRSVFSTEDSPAIEIVQPIRKATTRPPRAGTPVEFAFTLGDRVRVRRSDLDLDLPVSGQPRILISKVSQLDGYIDLEPGGRLPLLGKEFHIDAGRIWLDPEDSSNPLINITATWQAPEATVYIRMRGRWNTPELSMESDPAYSEEQIWVLLQGGSLQAPGTATSRTGGGQAAYGAAIALGVDQLLGNTPLRGLELSPNTKQGETSYKASYAVSDRIRLEGVYQPGGGLGKPASPMGDERRDAFAGAVEYRVDRHWAVRTEAGNASAGLDLLWQHRY